MSYLHDWPVENLLDSFINNGAVCSDNGGGAYVIQLSATAGYALLAMGRLATSRERWVLSREISAQTGIAGPYLSRVLHTLVKAGLVLAKRGYRGGFRLARPADQVSIMEIVEAVEKRSRTRRCLLGLAECSDQTACPVHALWQSASKLVESTLNQLMLSELTEVILNRVPRGVELRPEVAATKLPATERG